MEELLISPAPKKDDHCGSVSRAAAVVSTEPKTPLCQRGTLSCRPRLSPLPLVTQIASTRPSLTPLWCTGLRLNHFTPPADLLRVQIHTLAPQLDLASTTQTPEPCALDPGTPTPPQPQVSQSLFTDTPFHRSTRHLNSTRKLKDWGLCIRKKHVVIGDSTVSCFPPFSST